MPGTFEAVLVLIVLAGPGLVASPASRQIHLAGLPGVANSLTVLDATGAVVRDLAAHDVAALWIEINAEVRRVDVYRS